MKNLLTNSDPQESEMELWNSFRAGNREALNTIFDKYARLLFAYGRNMTRDQGLVSDCIQDIFVELWIKRESLSAQIISLKYYLIKSVRRMVLRRLASDRRFLGQPIPPDYHGGIEFHIEFSLIQDQISKDHSFQLKNSLAALSERQQEAIYLRFYEGMAYEEIASVMNTNVKAVYNLVDRSIVSLRKFFKAHPIASE